MKKCICCNEIKEYKMFDKRKKSKDGYRNQCMSCLYEKRKKRFENLTEDKKEEHRLKRNELTRKYNKNKSSESKLKEKKRKKKTHIKRLETDPLYKLRIAYSRRFNKCVKKFSIKNSYFLDNLGCSLEHFKNHIESKFEDWMNWNNYGLYNGELNHGWDIDHIIPMSSAKNEIEFNKLCHYTNLQPLCSKVNRDIKKDKIKNPL